MQNKDTPGLEMAVPLDSSQSSGDLWDTLGSLGHLQRVTEVMAVQGTRSLPCGSCWGCGCPVPLEWGPSLPSAATSMVFRVGEGAEGETQLLAKAGEGAVQP